jgi:RNA polymerase sigma-70 factor (ECF subfamily)
MNDAADEVDWHAFWHAIYEEQMPRVFNFFRYRLRVEDDATAQDLTATTFEKAWRARKQYQRNLAAFSTWLFTIARNTASDFFRQRQNFAQVSLDEVASLPGSETVDEVVQRGIDAEQLRKLLQALPDREQELIALRYGAGLTNRAIAELLKLSEANVAQILHRVILKLSREWRSRL